MEAVVSGGSAVAFETIREKLDRVGQVTPENVGTVASEMVGIAASLGFSAHLTAVLAEAVYFTKNLGLSQLAAMLAKVSGFEVMADAFLGAEDAAALRSPSRRRALRRVRPGV